MISFRQVIAGIGADKGGFFPVVREVVIMYTFVAFVKYPVAVYGVPSDVFDIMSDEPVQGDRIIPVVYPEDKAAGDNSFAVGGPDSDHRIIGTGSNKMFFIFVFQIDQAESRLIVGAFDRQEIPPPGRNRGFYEGA